VHRRQRRLPPVAQAFRQFLCDEGAGLLARIMAPEAPGDPAGR
jgi:hypothetical protein